MPTDCDAREALRPFEDEGWITEVLYEVKSGKEATVFCCRGGVLSPYPLVAAKVYRPLERRGFRNDAAYLEGRVHLARPGRASRAVRKHTAFGREVQYGTWIAEEWETMQILSEGGVTVPTPLRCGERAILMRFLGDETAPAPLLHEITPSPTRAATLVDQVLRDVELMLDHDCVHGDLSPYNVIACEEQAVIIDFPQAVDPRLNRNACGLLARDIERMCQWASRHGAERRAAEISARFWSRFVRGELG
ncbi:MAG: hypothetical protein KJO43_06490 [Phycisphaerae bacterium]|nr:hypothetical protein [Phycisphaerae bacterium]